MKLESCLNWMIFEFPTLYKSNTHAESRLKALNQLFLVIGNGYEWHKDGYLVACNQENNSKELESLPEGFFEKHLYKLVVYTTSVDKVKEGFQDRFHYFQERYIPNQTTCYFESESHQQALELHNKYAIDPRKIIRECLCHYMVHPYPISEHSAIMDVLKGKAIVGDNKELKLSLKPDWLAGCIEIAEDALNYFEDDTRNIDDSCHPIKNIQYMKYDLERSKNGIVFWQKNLKKGETIEEYAQRIWETHKTQQTKILKKFLAKFKTPT